MVLAVPNTIIPNSETNFPYSALMVTDTETTVDAPIYFVSVFARYFPKLAKLKQKLLNHENYELIFIY